MLVQTNNDAIFDFRIPPFVRAFIAMYLMSPMANRAVREAGLMPRVYGRYRGRQVRVVMASHFGDVGLSYEDKEFGNYFRASIYDVTDYRQEMQLFDHCRLGVGCEEYGVCYADVHDQPEQCGRR